MLRGLEYSFCATIVFNALLMLIMPEQVTALMMAMLRQLHPCWTIAAHVLLCVRGSRQREGAKSSCQLMGKLLC
jgi:hypothetical protein